MCEYLNVQKSSHSTDDTNKETYNNTPHEKWRQNEGVVCNSDIIDTEKCNVKSLCPARIDGIIIGITPLSI